MFRKNPVGFHTSLTAEVYDRIIEAVPQLLIQTQVAAKARISQQNLSNWLRRGEKDFEAGENTIYAQLFVDYHEKRSETVQECIQTLRNNGSFQAISWILEKGVKEDFGPDSGIVADIKEQHSEILKLIAKERKDEIRTQKGSEEND
jgi:hypothetical protein